MAQPRGTTCTECRGRGILVCTRCLGQKIDLERVAESFPRLPPTCPQCNGQGVITCPHCNGTGEIELTVLDL